MKAARTECRGSESWTAGGRNTGRVTGWSIGDSQKRNRGRVAITLRQGGTRDRSHVYARPGAYRAVMPGSPQRLFYRAKHVSQLLATLALASLERSLARILNVGDI